MPKSSDLFFATSNSNKFQEAKQIMDNFGINLRLFKCELEEIQSNSLKEIAKSKSLQAFQKCKKPVIVEDDGLFIDSLNGFPGPYSSYVFETIGNQGILKLLKQNRDAKFVSIISFYDKKNHETFESKVKGMISKTTVGLGWGYDPIFIPSKSSKTFAQSKNKVSHRFKALKKFSNWYLDKLG